VNLPDGRTVALEVTAAADSALISMYAAMGKRWQAQSLEWTQLVRPGGAV
jgi:hypothetical protein